MFPSFLIWHDIWLLLSLVCLFSFKLRHSNQLLSLSPHAELSRHPPKKSQPVHVFAQVSMCSFNAVYPAFHWHSNQTPGRATATPECPSASWINTSNNFPSPDSMVSVVNFVLADLFSHANKKKNIMYSTILSQSLALSESLALTSRNEREGW